MFGGQYTSLGIELGVATLAVMHDGYRLPLAEMRGLVDHVRAGGTFAAPIAVVRFEDGRWMLRDGLHRATAILLGRPSGTLVPGELVIEELTYDMFLRPAIDAGLLAPFDPRSEVRIADFSAFTSDLRCAIREGRDPEMFITEHRHVYVRPRRAHHDALATFAAACSPYGAL
jgi:hypothetical protein